MGWLFLAVPLGNTAVVQDLEICDLVLGPPLTASPVNESKQVLAPSSTSLKVRLDW